MGVALRVDKLGVVITFMIAYAACFAPFMVFRANRIVPGATLSIPEAMPAGLSVAFLVVVAATGIGCLLRTAVLVRLCLAATALAALAVAIGFSASFLTPAGNSYARVSPASGVWILALAYTLVATDAIARLKPPPFLRLLLLGATLAAFAALLATGLWADLSILREYESRADIFWLEAARHGMLALGSLCAAVIVGLPLGTLCHRVTPLRSSILNTLNLIQTIPSIALFGLLIAPLGWIALHVPGASALGIRGIGAAPAFVALFLYSLLPVVANTVAGLSGVSSAVNDAARGIGMTGAQRLFMIEFPLALPVILTGIRIVLVQNIGLATIAALIGGGGFGVFVFQGVGQTAMDLVMLGAVPTVILAVAAAIILDAVIEMSAPTHKRGLAG